MTKIKPKAKRVWLERDKYHLGDDIRITSENKKRLNGFFIRSCFLKLCPEAKSLKPGSGAYFDILITRVGK